MSKFKIPTVAEVAKFQKAALAEIIEQMGNRVPYRVEGDGSVEDLSICNLVPSKEYKAIISVKAGSSPVVALWVRIDSYDGSGSYGEWYTKIDGLWVSTEDISEFDEASGVYSWEA